MGPDAGLEKVWDRVAYATRYGHATMTEVLGIDQWGLQDYLEAVSRIVEQENRQSRK